MNLYKCQKLDPTVAYYRNSVSTQAIQHHKHVQSKSHRPSEPQVADLVQLVRAELLQDLFLHVDEHAASVHQIHDSWPRHLRAELSFFDSARRPDLAAEVQDGSAHLVVTRFGCELSLFDCAHMPCCSTHARIPANSSMASAVTFMIDFHSAGASITPSGIREEPTTQSQ